MGMRTITETKNIYKFEELSDEAKDRAKQWLWSDGYIWQDDALSAIKACLKAIGLELGLRWEFDFCNGQYRVRLEQRRTLTKSDLIKALIETKDLKHSGFCLEYDFGKGALECLESQSNGSNDPDADVSEDQIKEIAEAGIWELMRAACRDYEAQFQDSYCQEHCEANGYEFNEDGSVF